jgi:lipopolysaccharide biosynthesis protein
MRSICFFATYTVEPEIPFFSHYYLSELKKHFDKVVYCTSHSEIQKNTLLKEHDIDVLVCENKGYDFGQWHDALMKYDLHDYDHLGLVNDSCILFKPLHEFFEWRKNSHGILKGMTMNPNIFPHLQSYFLIVEHEGLDLIKEYFVKNGKKSSLTEIIHTYEVGLSKYFSEKGLPVEAFIKLKDYKAEYSPYYLFAKDFIRKGMPLIKRKIIFSSYRKDEIQNLARMGFDIDPASYIALMRENGAEIDLTELVKSQKNEFSFIDKMNYSCMRMAVNFKRLFRRSKNS